MIGLRRAIGLALLAALLVAGGAVGGRAAKTPPAGQKHTPAGIAAARRILLTKADFARSWTASPPGKSVPALTCAGSPPSTEGTVEIGAAVSPRFRAGSAGPFVSEAVYVYATDAQARTFWRRVTGAGLRRCLVQSVLQGSTSDVKFTVKKLEELPLPALGERRAAYRLTVIATATAQTVTAYDDMLLIGVGSAIAALSLSSFSEPVPEQLERALGRAVARRLAAG